MVITGTGDRLTLVVNTFAPLPIGEFRVAKFKDKKHKTPKYRPWLIFKFTDEAFCILQTITTQIDTLAKFYRADDNKLACLVTIPKNNFNPPLTETSYIDCNLKSQNYKKFVELAEEHIDWNDGLELCPEKFPESVRNNIISAILKSDDVPEDIKKIFR